MERKDKIKLLNDIAAGRKTIGETMPPIIRIWVQDKTNPDMFHCEAEKLTKRKDESLPDEMPGRAIINVTVIQPLPESEC